MLSIMIHSDKCKHGRASNAFQTVEQAYKTLINVDKRRIFQRVMREARDDRFSETQGEHQKSSQRIKRVDRRQYKYGYQRYLLAVIY